MTRPHTATIHPNNQKLALTTDQLYILIGNLGEWSTSATPNLRIVTNEPGLLVVDVPVAPSLANTSGNLHGGVIATMIDVLTSCAILAIQLRGSVTVDLHMTCLSNAPIGTTVTIESKVERMGNSLINSSCRIYAPSNENEGTEPQRGNKVLVATGSHTKKFVGKRLSESQLVRWVGPSSVNSKL